MATQPDDLIGTPEYQVQPLRCFPAHDGIRPGKLAQFGSDTELPNLTPLAFDQTNDQWAVFDDSVTQEVYTITSNSTPATAGTFTLSIDGETATVDFDATAAEIQTALEGLSNIAPGDVTCVATAEADLGVADAVVTITFGGNYSGVAVAITADFSGLTGNVHVLANTANGSGADTDQIDGFLWAPAEPHTALAAGETIIQVFRAGSVHHDDVPLPTTSSQTQAGLTAALKDQSLRMKNIEVLGLEGAH